MERKDQLSTEQQQQWQQQQQQGYLDLLKFNPVLNFICRFICNRHFDTIKYEFNQ